MRSPSGEKNAVSSGVPPSPVRVVSSEYAGPSICCRGGRATTADGPRESRPMGDVTHILADIERGDRHAAGQLLPLSTMSHASWPPPDSPARNRAVAPGRGPGPRGVPPARRVRPGQALRRPRARLRRRGAGDWSYPSEGGPTSRLTSGMSPSSRARRSGSIEAPAIDRWSQSRATSASGIRRRPGPESVSSRRHGTPSPSTVAERDEVCLPAEIPSRATGSIAAHTPGNSSQRPPLMAATLRGSHFLPPGFRLKVSLM